MEAVGWQRAARTEPEMTDWPGSFMLASQTLLPEHWMESALGPTKARGGVRRQRRPRGVVNGRGGRVRRSGPLCSPTMAAMACLPPLDLAAALIASAKASSIAQS